jgi:enoyl-CoA hydratase/carnithine racemase
MRGDLAESIRSATQHEWEQQRSLIATADFREGVAATAQRRTPTFIGG